MKLKIEFVKEAKNREDESSAVVKVMERKGDGLAIARSGQVPEGLSDTFTILPGQQLVIEFPDTHVEASKPSDAIPPQPAPNPNVAPPKPAQVNTLQPAAPPTRLPPVNTNPPPQAPGQSGQATGVGSGERGGVGTGPAPQPGSADNPTPAVSGAKPGEEGKGGEAGKPTNQPQQVGGRTIGVPSTPPKPIEKDKDASGNPIPAVDARGPTSHAPPPNETKKA